MGEKSEGRLRPRGPSGDDCIERVDGLAVEDVPLGGIVEAGVTVKGTEVLLWYLTAVVVVETEEAWKERAGDGQHLLPFVTAGEEVAEGDISYYAEKQITGSLL